MDRVVEPELMEEDEQGMAYAQADFSGPNIQFLNLFAEKCPRFQGTGRVLDLGCGPADILVRFVRRYPEVECVGIDGAEAMLTPGRHMIEQEHLSRRITLSCLRIPLTGSIGRFQAVLSNSLLHHLHNPEVLWRTVTECIVPGGSVLIMDLFRPRSREVARRVVATYAGNESAVLQADYYNSLLAAFRVDEVRAQLRKAGLDLACEEVSDRHLAVWGTLN